MEILSEKVYIYTYKFYIFIYINLKIEKHNTKKNRIKIKENISTQP